MTHYADPHTASALPDPVHQPEFYDSVTPKRLFAWIVDTVVILVLGVLIIPFTAFTALFFLPVFFFAVGFAYRVITLSGGSATWGMRLMAIELRQADGRRFDLSAAFLHTLGYTVSMAFVIVQALSIVLMLASARGQGLSDHVLGTVMLNRRR